MQSFTLDEMHIHFHIEMCWVHSAYTLKMHFIVFLHSLFHSFSLSAYISHSSFIRLHLVCRQNTNTHRSPQQMCEMHRAFWLNRSYAIRSFQSISMNYWRHILCFYALIWKYCVYIFWSVSVVAAHTHTNKTNGDFRCI